MFAGKTEGINVPTKLPDMAARFFFTTEGDNFQKQKNNLEFD